MAIPMAVSETARFARTVSTTAIGIAIKNNHTVICGVKDQEKDRFGNRSLCSDGFYNSHRDCH